MKATSENDIVIGPQRLTCGVKIMYGLGEIANSIKVVTFGLYSLFFATSVLGLAGMWIGVIGLTAMVWDALIDPYIGYVTDGPGAHLRRRRFMLLGALTMGLGYCAFFSPPRNVSELVLVVWLMAASIIVRTATSMYSIPYYAVGVNLSDDYNERTSIMGVRGMVGIAGTLMTATLSFVLFFHERVPGVDPKLEHAGYAWMGLSFGLTMTVVALVATFTTRATPTGAAGGVVTLHPSPREFFSVAYQFLRNPSFRILLASSCLGVMALAVSSSLMLHFVKYYVKADGSASLSSAQAVFFIAGFAGTGFWLRMSKRFDKHRLYMFSALTTSALMVMALLLFGDGHPLGTGDIRPLLIGYGLAGLFNCVVWFIPQSMLADVADESEWATGQRREGAMLGLVSFAQQVATGAAIMLAGALLDRYVGLVPVAAPHSADVAHRIGVSYSIVPAVLFTASALLMHRYSLTRSRVAFVQQELQQRRTTDERVYGDRGPAIGTFAGPHISKG